MLYRFWFVIGRLFNRDYIPPLPWGMLATAYDDIPEQERRVMARHGARDPAGVKVAMRRAGVTDIDALMSRLDHYTPERQIKERLHRAVGRAVGGLDHDPHEKDIHRIGSAYHARQARATKEIEARVKVARKAYKEKTR